MAGACPLGQSHQATRFARPCPGRISPRVGQRFIACAGSGREHQATRAGFGRPACRSRAGRTAGQHRGVRIIRTPRIAQPVLDQMSAAGERADMSAAAGRVSAAPKTDQVAVSRAARGRLDHHRGNSATFGAMGTEPGPGFGRGVFMAQHRGGRRRGPWRRPLAITSGTSQRLFQTLSRKARYRRLHPAPRRMRLRRGAAVSSGFVGPALRRRNPGLNSKARSPDRPHHLCAPCHRGVVIEGQGRQQRAGHAHAIVSCASKGERFPNAAAPGSRPAERGQGTRIACISARPRSDIAQALAPSPG